MATAAQYAATPVTASAVISAANTGRDGTGTIVDVLTAGTNGTRIDDITIIATGAVTAGVVRLFLNDGANTRLWKEILVTAITPSVTVEAWKRVFVDLALVIKTGWKLQASTHNAETFNIFVTRAGDL